MTGNCSFNPSHEVKVSKTSEIAFNVTTEHLCGLYIVNDQIADFTILLESEISIHPKPDHLNFKVTEAFAKIEFRKVNTFSVENT